MFYKILSDDKLVDVINSPQYVCYINEVIPINCTRSKATAIISSDGTTVWHIQGWGKHPPLATTLYRIVEITPSEYQQLKDILQNDIKVLPQEEKKEVISDEQITLEAFREHKIKTMREFCQKAIVAGFDITLSSGDEHFALELEDQINLTIIQDYLRAGAEWVPYHSSGSDGRLYSKEEAQLIISHANKHRIWHTTYFNAMRSYITQLNSIAIISDLYYGCEIPEEYQTEAFKSLLK